MHLQIEMKQPKAVNFFCKYVLQVGGLARVSKDEIQLYNNFTHITYVILYLYAPSTNLYFSV